MRVHKLTRSVPFIGFVVMASLFALKDLAIWSTLGSQFTPFSVAYPISAQVYDETHMYAPGPRRFFEKTSLKTEVDLFELRDVPSVYPVVHSIIIGGMAKLVGSLDVAWVVAHGIFPAAAWFLFFFCGKKIGLRVTSALLLSTGVCLIAFGPRNYFLLGQDALNQPLELTRIANRHSPFFCFCWQ